MEKKRYLQERVATETYTFPVVLVCVVARWLVCIVFPAEGETDMSGTICGSLLPESPLFHTLAGGVLFGVALGLFLLLDRTFGLLRVRSDFYLTLYAVLTVLFVPLTLQTSSLVVPCMLLAARNIFHSYKEMQPAASVFQAFLCIGVGSLFFPPLFWFLPLLYGMLGRFHALTRRTFFAGLTGLALPYWLLFAYAAGRGDLNLFLAPFSQVVPAWPPDYGAWSVSRWLAVGYVLFLSVAGGLHGLVNSYEDKIKVRLFLSYFLMWQVWTALLLFMQPQHYSVLFPLLIAGCCFPVSHLFALDHSRGGNVFFLFCAGLLAAVVLYSHLWSN